MDKELLNKIQTFNQDYLSPVEDNSLLNRVQQFSKKNHDVGMFGVSGISESLVGEEDIIDYPSQLQELEISNPLKVTSPIAIGLANMVHDPNKKIEIFAKYRDLSPDDYAIQNGEIVFRDKDGTLYSEESSGVVNFLRREGNKIALDPTTYMTGGAGVLARKATQKAATFGAKLAVPATEALGAYLGETAKQQYAKYELGEDRPMSQDAWDAGTVVGLGLAGEGVGRVLKWGSKKTLDFLNIPTPGSKNARINSILDKMNVFDKKNIKKISDIEFQANRFGIPLNIAEKLENIEAISTIKNLNSRETRKIYEQRVDNLMERVPRFVTNLLPKSTKNPNFSAKIYVNQELEGLSKEAAKLIRPFYELAFEKSPTINTKKIVDQITEKIDRQNITVAEASALKKITRDLIKVKSVKGENVYSYDIPIKKIDKIKKQIDEGIYSQKLENMSSFKKVVNKELDTLKKDILSEADKISPEYKHAREIASLIFEGSSKLGKTSSTEAKKYAQLGDQLKNKKNLLMKTSKIPDEDIRDIGSYILSTKNSDPTIANAVKNAIYTRENGKEIWKSIVGDHILYQFGNIPTTGKMNPDIGGEMWKSIFGSKAKSDVMKVALRPDQYHDFYTFFNLIRKTGLTIPPQKGVSNTDIKSRFISPALRSLKPFISKETILADAIQSIVTKKGVKQFVDILWDPNIGSKLAAMSAEYESNKNKELLINQLIATLGFSTAQVISNNINQ